MMEMNLFKTSLPRVGSMKGRRSRLSLNRRTVADLTKAPSDLERYANVAGEDADDNVAVGGTLISVVLSCRGCD